MMRIAKELGKTVEEFFYRYRCVNTTHNKQEGISIMVTVYTPGKKFECAEVNPIQFKLLITETGQEYLLMYDLSRQYLYSLQRLEGERPDFTYVAEVIRLETEVQRASIYKTSPK
ncbi:MAG: hypothetical protein H6Q72_1490 [Firmicutes bacterium]|nr:hypothetical protein [Bacillota bacterium]